MFQQLISSMLGPSGVLVLQWYTEHSLIVNGAVVLLALVFVVAPRFSRRYQQKLQALWDRSPFALSEKDRRAVEAAKAKWAQNKRGRK